MANFGNILNNTITYIVNPLIFLLISVATVVFLWGVFKFIRNAGEGGEDRADAVRSIVWGLVGLVIMFSVFGIVAVIKQTVGFKG